MADHFESPRLLIDRARGHIDELEAQIRAFWNGKPCVQIVDFDHETGQDVHKLRLREPLPTGLKTITKDASGNLRDALDHAVYGATVALGNPSPEKTKFPFASTANGVKGELNGRYCRDIPPEIHPILMSFDPHQTGNQLLWGLNQIRNPNTHRILVPVLTAITKQTINFTGTVCGGFQMGYSKWNPAKNEVEYLRMGRGSKAHYKVDATLDVTFGDIGVLAGKQAIGTLRLIADEVERVVTTIEAETAKLI